MKMRPCTDTSLSANVNNLRHCDSQKHGCSQVSLSHASCCKALQALLIAGADSDFRQHDASAQGLHVNNERERLAERYLVVSPVLHVPVRVEHPGQHGVGVLHVAEHEFQSSEL